jgi:hypothetical protein
MTNYATTLNYLFPTTTWSIIENDYSTLQWLEDTPQPTQAELDAAWPEANYHTQSAQVEAARLLAYEQTSDPIFFKWQRGDATEAEWRAAVAKVKADNPYPPAP